MGSKKRRWKRNHRVNRVYTNQIGDAVRLHRDEGAETGELRIVGSVPCVICKKELTQADVDAQEVLGSCVNTAIMACMSHFAKRNSTGIWYGQTPDFQKNIEKLSLAIATSEGWIQRKIG